MSVINVYSLDFVIPEIPASFCQKGKLPPDSQIKNSHVFWGLKASQYEAHIAPY